MKTFEVIADVIVILSLIYVSFVLTLADWLAGMSKGQAVSLLPERNGRTYPFWVQIGLVVLGLALFAAMAYFLWIPLFPLSLQTGFLLEVSGLVLYAAGCLFIQTGPYAIVRNPMYFGWWVAMLGLILLYPVWMVLLMFLFSLVSFIGRAHREEAALAARFGQTWTEYKKHTKFLIPFIY